MIEKQGKTEFTIYSSFRIQGNSITKSKYFVIIKQKMTHNSKIKGNIKIKPSGITDRQLWSHNL